MLTEAGWSENIDANRIRAIKIHGSNNKAAQFALVVFIK